MDTEQVQMTAREAALYRAGVSFGRSEGQRESAQLLREAQLKYEQQLLETKGQKAVRKMKPWLRIFEQIAGGIIQHSNGIRSEAARQMIEAARLPEGRSTRSAIGKFRRLIGR